MCKQHLENQFITKSSSITGSQIVDDILGLIALILISFALIYWS